MRKIGKFLGVLLLIIAAVAIWKREEIGRLQAVLGLFKPEQIVQNFSHMDAAFLTRSIAVAPPVMPLPQGAPMPAIDGLEAWQEARSVTAMVVLHDGALVAETYRLGTGPDDKRISWSVAKSYLSALFGIVQAEGAIQSLDDLVTQYVPGLVGTAYDGVTVRDVLTMQSGVKFNEDYLDFWSDINKMGRVLALGQSMDGFAAGLTERERAPGEVWQYVSIDTHVIGMVIRGATGRGIVDLMQEKLIGPMGLEAASYYVTDGLGEPFVLGGLNLITRDYARMGQLFLDMGRRGNTQIVPELWVNLSTAPQANTADGAIGYGYQWWVPQGAEPGEFLARGIYGQYIYVNRATGVVIAVNSADRGFREPGAYESNIAMFRKIASAYR
ncbi:class C beta-lactamase-related serine hydrolase [Pseudorhodobacter sp. E13]|uniref:serine hydrolase domain-containing protein n=1 Tax=Pseudorhodobacter sp. E13 TaxID=2487931 RepID=UPI000F8CFD07|nr:serine hydrolase [Pseudorhodobacter sp. E13]RUS63458.1 class C beta-lactamase-related serine hydrolase [Pseudorhodobacter sp. E13]